jgi:hypothetical protein
VQRGAREADEQQTPVKRRSVHGPCRSGASVARRQPASSSLREGYALRRRGKPAGFVVSLYQPQEGLGVEAQPAQPAPGTR